MRESMLRYFGVVALTVLLVLVLSLTWTGCGERSDVASNPQISQQSTVLDKDNPIVKAVIDVQDRHTSEIMQNSNVVGTATGLLPDGRLGVYIYVKEAPSTKGKTIDAMPVSLEGVPVYVEVTGAFKALKSTAVSHTAKQTPPIQLGTSGGWRYDLANGYCCGGTLGSLVKIGTTQYILSNYHVFRADIVPGGNGRVATNGDPIIQPGLVDVSCNAANAQNVGTLAGTASLPGSNVDCAIAQVISGMVSTTGSILEVGTISATTQAASIGMAVKKSGRTSGLTRTTVQAINGTVSIQYENECAGGIAFTKTFTSQVVLKGGRFIQSGDSGSLLVQDVTTNPKAVGLCFAGSSQNGIANPISQVLSFLGATMVGQ
ncbi:MAG: hypothetical protein ACHQQQ_00835 [Bacteroidota bacterium]